MLYTTRDNVTIEIGRVDRRRLDVITAAEPTPPTRKVETWGGIFEDVPVYDDPHYMRSLYRWRVGIWRERLKTIVGALTFTLPPECLEDLAALRAMGIGEGNPADYLRYGVTEYDQACIVEEVYYQSTVSNRGINEAEARLGYTWRDKPLSAWSVGFTHGRRGALAVDMHTALRSGMTWGQFCELPGPEQSLLVAFWNLEERLAWLSNQPSH